MTVTTERSALPVLSVLPWALTTLRLVLAPVLVVLAHASAGGPAFLACLAAGFCSDVLDGVLARRLGVQSPALRRYDVVADVAFYLAVLWCACVRSPEVVLAYAWPLAGILLAEVACQALSLVRFGQSTATHAYLCKAWAVLLFASTALLLGFGVTTLLAAMFVVGGLAYLDVLLILILAPTAPVDVPSALHAWRARRAAARSTEASPGPAAGD
jgi:CDP-diacylglycerol--glycerol-3-phosphate 3-phosphatidyltransferase